ncbi:hypothetical protein ASF48_17635 [Rathayibacter sp. Leaf299]|uniref:DUF7927 domain-containing protein n=1 Tax=Rathayibacter sp. Leaf299 TaxID=1736328 RepID=UPI0006FBF2C5|nr:DUF11 domain-containing protein [Rathayibacter sp. Leaf299]KQQ18741.1 hypothetical protein ASF48_17635 [Rathayibacter sp. Leaf299]
MLSATTAGCVLAGGLLLGGVVPSALAADANASIPNTLLQGGWVNEQTTTVSAWVKAGERFTVNLHPLKAGSGDAEGESAGGSAVVKDPTGKVLASKTYSPGAGPDQVVSGDYVAPADGIYTVAVSDIADGKMVNLVWDIGVKSTSGEAIAGRVWSTSWGLQSGAKTSFATNSERASTFTLHAITETGARYDMTLRDYDGIGSTVQANNKGNVKIGSSDPSYLSVPMQRSAEADGIGADYFQSSNREKVEGLQTYKLFLDPPAADLPESIAPKYSAPTISDLAFKRSGTGSNAGTLTGVLGTQPGTVKVTIDADGDGSYDGEKDVSLTTIVAKPGGFSVAWDGKDAAGDTVDITDPAVTFRATLNRTNEFHFTRVDTEASRGGIEIRRLSAGDTDASTVYWDDSLLVPGNAVRESTTPLTSNGKNGVDSTGGVHGWDGETETRNPNTGLSGSYGDYRSIDDYTFGTDGAEATAPLAALEPHVTLTKTSTVPSDQKLVPGQTVPYTLTLTSDGSGDWAGGTVTDFLDDGVLDDATLDTASIKASSGTADIEESTGRIIWTAGTIPAGQTATLEFTVTLNDAAGISEDRELVNTACLAAPGEAAALQRSVAAASTASNECATVPHTIGEGKLWIKKSTEQAQVENGGTGEFQILVGNSGDLDATDVSVTDVPSLEHFTNATITLPDGTTQPADTPVTGLDIPAGGQVLLTVSGTVDSGYQAVTIPNRAKITEQPPGFTPPTVENPCIDDATSSCTELTTQKIPGQLDIKKTAHEESTSHGKEAGFDIVVSNTGKRTAENFTLRDVPNLEHLRDVTISRDGGTKSAFVDHIDGITLKAGESTTLSVVGTVADGTDAWTIENRATLTNLPGGFEPPTVQNPCTDDAAYSCADVTVPKVTVATPPKPGGFLASTGADSGPFLIAGSSLLLLGLGAVTVTVIRRRRNTATEQ